MYEARALHRLIELYNIRKVQWYLAHLEITSAGHVFCLDLGKGMKANWILPWLMKFKTDTILLQIRPRQDRTGNEKHVNRLPTIDICKMNSIMIGNDSTKMCSAHQLRVVDHTMFVCSWRPEWRAVLQVAQNDKELLEVDLLMHTCFFESIQIIVYCD